MALFRKQSAWDKFKAAVADAAAQASDTAGTWAASARDATGDGLEAAGDGLRTGAVATGQAVRTGAVAVGRGVVAVEHKVESVANGMLAGAIAGALAAWAMNQFQAAGAKPASDAGGPAEGGPADDNATTKVAEKVTQQVAGRDLKPEEKPAAGAAVHYGYGAAMGALYGGLTELVPAVGIGLGIPYATALWLFGDEIAVPALGLGKPPAATTPEEHATALSSHFVYGVTLDVARRVLRHIV